MNLYENSFYDFSMPIFEIENYILNLGLSDNQTILFNPAVKQLSFRNIIFFSNTIVKNLSINLENIELIHFQNITLLDLILESKTFFNFYNNSQVSLNKLILDNVTISGQSFIKTKNVSHYNILNSRFNKVYI